MSLASEGTSVESDPSVASGLESPLYDGPPTGVRLSCPSHAGDFVCAVRHSPVCRGVGLELLAGLLQRHARRRAPDRCAHVAPDLSLPPFSPPQGRQRRRGLHPDVDRGPGLGPVQNSKVGIRVGSGWGE